MFDASTYRTRRRRLVQQDRLDTGLALFLGNGRSSINYGDNTYSFRQDSTFLYYFGLNRADLVGVIDLDDGSSMLYGEDVSLEDVIWMGDQPALRDQADAVGVENVASPADLEEDLASAQERGRPIHFLPPYRAAHRVRYESLLGIDRDKLDDEVSEALIRAVVRQRSRKSEAEVAQLEEALEVTAQLHEYAMRNATPGTTEREILGALKGVATSVGTSLAFTPTCSIHGEILHNYSYPNTLSEGDLFLLDAGTESSLHYAGDITRTTPVGGEFSERQRAVYDAVLAAEKAGLDKLEPDVPFKEVHLHSARVLTEHLIDIGLMQGSAEEAVEAGAHALFFPHGLGHMLGLDAHDMENLGEEYVGYADNQSRSEQFGLHTLRLARPLEPGHVVTVEPGCYFIPKLIERWSADGKHDAFINYDLVEDFVGLGGVRIEDDALLTDDGARVLGPDIPKEPEDVASLAGTT